MKMYITDNKTDRNFITKNIFLVVLMKNEKFPDDSLIFQ